MEHRNHNIYARNNQHNPRLYNRILHNNKNNKNKEEEVIEYIATIFTLTGIVFNIFHNRICFIIWFVGNCLWIYIALDTNLYGLALTQIIINGTCVWGWFAWKSDPYKKTLKNGKNNIRVKRCKESIELLMNGRQLMVLGINL